MERVSLLIVGAGGWATPGARTWPPAPAGGSLSALMRPRAPPRWAWQGFTPAPIWSALAQLQPDFVVDVTLTALAACVPVLGEKPMAASIEQARAMVAAAERADKLPWSARAGARMRTCTPCAA